MTPPVVAYLIAAVFLSVASYGFVDHNLTLSNHPWYTAIQGALSFVVYRRPQIAAYFFVAFLLIFYWLYWRVIRVRNPSSVTGGVKYFFVGVVLLVLSYPALSYDLFNYIATAKVTFQYRENPYLVMPVEVPNEPMLAYTRAANKLALYGPVWIFLTGIPHVLGGGNILVTIFTFKALVAAAYLVLVFLIWKITKDIRQAEFFALNPLIIIETLVSGHNDVVMMVLALAGLLWIRETGVSKRLAGWILLLSSVFVKGATVVLLPLGLFRKLPMGKLAILAWWLLFGVFLLSPLREEMYPWYGVWWLTFASLIPIGRHSFVHGFSLWLSLGLMLRYVPYLATREYGGTGPMWRFVLTVIPVGIYLVWYGVVQRRLNKNFIFRKRSHVNYKNSRERKE